MAVTLYEQNTSYTIGDSFNRMKNSESVFLVCLVILAGLSYFCLVVGLTVGLAMGGVKFKSKDVAVGFSG